MANSTPTPAGAIRKFPEEVNATPLELAILLAAREQLNSFISPPAYFDLKISVTPDKVHAMIDPKTQVIIDRIKYTIVINCAIPK